VTLFLTTHETAASADIEAVDTGLVDSNDKEPSLQDVQPLSVFAKDETNRLVGGAVGRTWGQCVELQQLWVADEMRHQGLATRLMQHFESAASARGCTLAYLETFSFQAPAFYAKAGYSVALEIGGFTGGQVKYTMQKLL
jgi:GNAT superfamily N-acetyltransferase